MSGASILNRFIFKVPPNLKTQTHTHQAASKHLVETILNHIKADSLSKAVSVLFNSPFTFPFSLYARLFKLCSSNLALLKLESHLFTFNPSPPVFLVNRAIEAYGACGFLNDAKKLFGAMRQRDGGSWNAIIKACAQLGSGEEALGLFSDMRLQGVCPNEITLASVLGSCGVVLDLFVSRQVHGLVLKYGFYENVILRSSLVDVYGKCGDMDEARRMFDEIDCPNEVTWNVIIRRYLEVGDVHEAVVMFFKMFRVNTRPLSYTLSNALLACSGLFALEEGMQIHGLAAKLSFDGDAVVSSSLIGMYAKCGKVGNARRIFDQISSRDLICWTSMVSAYAMTGGTREARELFNKMPERNVVSWNAMLAGYTRNLQWEEALDFVLLMCRTAKPMDSVTLGLVLNVCAGLSDLELGKQVHGFIYRHGIYSNIFVGNALLDMYGKCGNLKSAGVWFYQMSQSRDCISWNALLTSYARHQRSEQAISTFGEMQWQTKPSEFTFGTLLTVCANIGAIDQGKQIHGFIVRNGYLIDTVIRGALVCMYSKCHHLLYALLIFREAASRDLILWNSMILGCCHNRMGKEVLRLFKFMEEEGVQPDHVTFRGVLRACLSEGRVKLGMQYFDSMSDKYYVMPQLEHYECMIELFCKFGCKKELKQFIKGMSCEPTNPMLTKVIDACREYGWTRLGEWAAERLKELNA
ncbi:hypothetical protein K2173_026884 [Erythroxylum novogranatense]|uniref:Uncharacterized protein n=1 Tax=Erythroxylum novogranatense TaxID=1862640 RepID=A0AAV8TXQ1_9ROSI|nr:hypothetical protein K2173_026884 [Erythroxylum novogranatense]